MSMPYPFTVRVLRRLVAWSLVGGAALALGGCPLSNWSNPEVNPAKAQTAPTPPPVTPPAPPPVEPAPPATTPPPAASVPAAPAALPIAADGMLTTAIDTMKAGSLEGSGNDPLTYAIVVPSVNGEVKLTDPRAGTFTYAPAAGFSGRDAFQFTVADAAGVSKPATVAITVTPSPLGALTTKANLGANLDGVTYYSFAQPFVDMIHMASGWGSTKSDLVHGAGVQLGQIDMLDANGWPLEDASTNFGCCVVPDGTADDPGPVSPLVGRYQLTFTGKAKVSFLAGTVENLQYDAASNTSTATLVRAAGSSSNGAAHMIVTFSDTQRTAASAVNTGITNVSLIRPQFAPNGTKWWDSPTQEFTNPFLATLTPFSTLRFMDWMVTNGTQVADWNQRTPGNWPTTSHLIKTNGAWEWNATTHQTESTDNWWSSTGQSWERAIDLVNLTGKDLWINVPVRATDDYVRNLAALLKQKLKPGLHVYVEYSNEVWNSGFEQWYANDAATKALLADNPAAAKNYTDHCISWANDICHVAERLLQISNGFASGWGAAAINTTIRPVFCHQLVGASAMQMALAYINDVYGAPNKFFYGVCGAPYWGAPAVAGQSADDFLAASNASIPKWVGYTLAYTAAARYYGLHTFMYESGLGTDDRSELNMANLTTANLDPRMGQQVTDALTGMFQNGVDMPMYFVAASAWSKYGFWGATKDIFNLHEPKWAALAALSGQTITRTLAVTAPDPSKAVPYPGTMVPGTIDAGKPMFGVVNGTMRPLYQAAVNCSTATPPDVCSLYAGRAQGNGMLGYMVLASRAGTYHVTLKLDSRNKTQAATAQLYVNQQPQGGSIAIAAADQGAAVTAAPFDITLPSGISLIELEATSGTVSVNGIVVDN